MPHGNICGCSCLELGGVPSRPGALQCNVGVSIVVESNTDAPCGQQCNGGVNHGQSCVNDVFCPGGVCEDDTLMVMDRRCIPITTETASGLIVDTNNTSPKEIETGHGASVGVPTLCDDLATSMTTGMELVGVVNFLDSNLGDLAIAARFSCQ